MEFKLDKNGNVAVPVGKFSFAPQALVEAEQSLGAGMKGIDAASLPEEARLQGRGW